MRRVVTALLVLLVAAPVPACKKPKLDPSASYGSDPINIKQKEGEMLLPKEIPGERDHVVQLHISASAVLVFGEAVVTVKDGKVDELAKRDGPDGFFIDPLFKRLKKEAGKRKQAEKEGGLAFRGEAMIVAHRGTPYRLIAEVLYTMNQAEFVTYQFVIAQR
ncbi:MAG: hypothetical protein ABI333_03120 [bacterium]